MICSSRFFLGITVLSIAAIECLVANGLREYPTGQGTPTSQTRLPDPRYRPALGIWEIDRVASMVAKATGQKIHGKIYVSNQPQAPFASVCGPVFEGKIVINPRAAVEVPPNSWAFVIAHEFAHQIYRFGDANRTDPEQEFKADVIGAGFAIQAGFDLAAHVAWVFMRPDGGEATHGSRHGRAFRLAAQFGISRAEIERHMGRYQAARMFTCQEMPGAPSPRAALRFLTPKEPFRVRSFDAGPFATVIPS